MPDVRKPRGKRDEYGAAGSQCQGQGAASTYLNYSSNPLADLPRCRAIWGMSHKLGGNVRCTPVRWRVVTSTTLCWDLLFPSPLASAVIKAAMKSVEKCEGGKGFCAAVRGALYVTILFYFQDMTVWMKSGGTKLFSYSKCFLLFIALSESYLTKQL